MQHPLDWAIPVFIRTPTWMTQYDVLSSRGQTFLRTDPWTHVVRPLDNSAFAPGHTQPWRCTPGQVRSSPMDTTFLIRCVPLDMYSHPCWNSPLTYMHLLLLSSACIGRREWCGWCHLIHKLRYIPFLTLLRGGSGRAATPVHVTSMGYIQCGFDLVHLLRSFTVYSTG